MDSFIETIAHYCFPELLQPAVLLELKKPGNFRNQVQSLSRLCIRDIVRPRIKPESVGFVRFKLLFQEELDISKTSQLIRDIAIFNDYHGLNFLLCGFSRFLSRQLKIQFKNDPDIMQQVMEQNLDQQYGHCLCVVIMEKSFQAVLDDVVVVEVGHENYNTEWALVFSRMAFEKKVDFVEIEVEINRSECQAKQVLCNFINQIGFVSPEDEHWETACQNSRDQMYLASSSFGRCTKPTHSSLRQAYSIAHSVPDRFLCFGRILMR